MTQTLPSSASADNPTLRFLRLILPVSGFKCVFALKGKWHRFQPTHEGLLPDIVEVDRFTDCYHGCASYSQATDRKRANAHLVQSLWLDVDVGPKGYPSKQDAAQALAAFCQVVGLPVPLVIDSGGGLHVYWPLAVPMAVPTWQLHADGLKALCEDRGFRADPKRTADVASILRPPGARNHKYDPPLPVEVVLWADPYPAEAFALLPAAAPKRVNPGPKKSELTMWEEGPPAWPYLRQALDHAHDNILSIVDQLERIPSDDYQNWLHVGFALFQSREPLGRFIFDAWSARAPNYNLPPKTQDVIWEEFKQRDSTWDGPRVHIGTIFELAKRWPDERTARDRIEARASWEKLFYLAARDLVEEPRLEHIEALTELVEEYERMKAKGA